MPKRVEKAVRDAVERISDQVPTLVSDNPRAAAAGAVGMVAAAAAGLVVRHRKRTGTEATSNLHVAPADEGWAIREDGQKSDIEVHARKRDAVRAGRQLAAERRPSSLTVHRADGKVSRTHTYAAKG